MSRISNLGDKTMFDLRRVDLSDVRELIEQTHAYKSVGNACVAAFAVYESNVCVAAYTWQPPPFGAAKSVCPEAPSGVLSLSRMVAVDRRLRLLPHISKPLRKIMKYEIDRTRWPVLVTYSDESLGHTGHVYKCSGWKPTARALRKMYIDPASGARTSSYANGAMRDDLSLSHIGYIQRWEHRICKVGETEQWMARHGWSRVPTGGFYASGNPAYRWVRQ